MGLIFRPSDTFQNRLKNAMGIRKMTQADLARATGLNKGGISNYVTGRYEPKAEIIQKLALALNCSEAWLRGWDVPMHPVQKYEIFDEITGTYDDEDPTLVKIYSYLDTFSQEEREQLLQCLKQNDCTASNNVPSLLTPHETKVMTAYRDQPDMQPAVDKLLGVTEDGYVLVYEAASSVDNHPPRIVRMTKEHWETIKNAPETDEDL